MFEDTNDDLYHDLTHRPLVLEKPEVTKNDQIKALSLVKPAQFTEQLLNRLKKPEKVLKNLLSQQKFEKSQN